MIIYLQCKFIHVCRRVIKSLNKRCKQIYANFCKLENNGRIKKSSHLCTFLSPEVKKAVTEKCFVTLYCISQTAQRICFKTKEPPCHLKV